MDLAVIVRDYRVLKVVENGEPTFMVIARNIRDTDIWDVVNRLDTEVGAWRYVRETQERQEKLELSQSRPNELA